MGASRWSRGRKFDTYREWARHYGADPNAPYIDYRCDRCSRKNRGQEDCHPRNWFKIPDEYDSAITSGLKSRRIQGLVCARCGDEWERAKRNRPLELEKGLLVTPQVERRLCRRAESEVSPPPRLRLLQGIESVVWLSLFLLLVVVLKVALDLIESDEFHALAWIGVIAAPCVPFLVIRIVAHFEKPLANEYRRQVHSRVIALAKQRREVMSDRARFYSSAEWQQTRTEVIREQGRVCSRCGRVITNDWDLTVDHIRPRSKYPELSLDKENLQVLCRSCNASKGTTEAPS